VIKLMRGPIGVTAAAMLLLCIACSRERTYDLRGQVLAVDPSRQELTVKHEDIRGFMPGMTMPFKVRDAAAVRDRKPGDLIRATLVVQNSNAYLRDVARTGDAEPIDAPPHASLAPLNPGDTVPDASFVDQRGTSRRLSDWRGCLVAVTFGYTRCPLPDFCPLMDRHFAAVQRAALSDAALKDRLQLLSISFDLAHDTPAVLTDHAGRAGADPAMWTFVTGDAVEIDRFASAFGVSIVREEPDAREIVHNLRTGLIDADGRLVRVLTGSDWTPEDLLACVRELGASR
jgi:protein SCO1/2